MKTIKWGILGLGKIANHFVEDLLQVKHAQLYAVASRSQAKADEFANKYKANKSYGTYEDLYNDNDVDVIYIATPHAFHMENTIAAIKANKAVLCEKPIALNYKQARRMVDEARAHKVFLMEGIWTNFMPHLQKVNSLTATKTYGNIKHITAEFCFKPDYNPKSRLFNPQLGGGALLDIGIYTVFLSLKLLGIPDEIKVNQVKAKTGVDLETQLLFSYANGATANLLCSFAKTTPGEALIEYNKAKIKLHSRFHETDQMSIISEGKTAFLDFKHQYRGFNFEIEHVQECLRKGLTESPKLPLDFSLKLISLLDEIQRIADANPHV